ncbi:hypothetical protein IH785_12330 [candidate division KSB1 bacterium]|nr:hypothetical protein [candidate division KSB1 bacterium]
MKYLKQLTFIILLSSIGLGCGSSLKLDSQWRDRVISVDGKHEEWQEGMNFVEKENVAVGFFNDEDYLYVSMTTSNRDIQRQFMAMGFAIWFDPDGGKKKEFGILFPVGMMEMGLMMRGRGQSQDIATLRENFKKSLNDLEIFMPGEKEPRRMPVADATGIEVTLGDSHEQLIYEIKVPLHKSEIHPYAIAAKADKPIGIGFETAQLDREKMRERMGRGGMGSRPPGGSGGGRGGMGGGRGGRGGGMGGRPQMPEQFKLWAQVQLSSEGSTQKAQLITNQNPIISN